MADIHLKPCGYAPKHGVYKQVVRHTKKHH